MTRLDTAGCGQGKCCNREGAGQQPIPGHWPALNETTGRVPSLHHPYRLARIHGLDLGAGFQLVLASEFGSGHSFLAQIDSPNVGVASQRCFTGVVS